MKITEEAKILVDRIFDKAHKEGRTVLYEYEVYGVLESIGLTVPKFQFVTSEEDLTDEMLEQFGQDMIVKIVSPDIAHKQKIGGVKKVHNYDTLFVRYVLNSMKNEVLSHFEEGEKPEITGFLIVEFVPFSQSLGHEILFGVKDDPSFGPILTLSKGGDDAEFFAKYYDPANLFLPHFSYEQAVELVSDLNIGHKFEKIGHPEYLDFIAEAASLISSLAYSYSAVSDERPNYFITQLDINPFVITKDGRFVAVDGFAVFEKVEETSTEMPDIITNNVEPFFNPEGIAVLGVSSNLNKYSMAKDIVQLLHDLGRDDLYCINPKGGEIELDGKVYPLYKNLDEIPGNVELVVYAAPAKHIVPFFKSLHDMKNVPRSVVLIPGIPSEIKYSDFADQVKEVLPEGVRIVGPNCMGVYYGPGGDNKGVNTLFIEEDRLHLRSTEKSNTALLTQSGGVAITLIDKLEHSPIFRSIVSFGNKFDVNITDLMAYFNDDDNIDVIAIYVEGFDGLEGRRFFELANEIKKPIVVYKSGKTDAGAKAAASHTAAMTGDYDVFKAVCDQSGVILIEDIKSYYDVLKAFSLLGDKKPKGLNVAGVMNAGFEATVAADELGKLQPAKFSAETKNRLDEINTHGLMDTNTPILDVTPMTNDVMYGQIVEALLQDDAVDCVFVGVVPHVENIKATPELCHDKDSLANILIDIHNKYDKPIVVSVNAGEYYDEFVTMMEDAGLAVYSDIRSAVKVLEKVAVYYNS
ncbi:acetate--CoA ligase family protein [Vallitalea okinawensis]|uniref:acetate--CoA ligase family protein n=1 Tax=Vallitalea okinawensis TaxID=2078660 RepID=UPI000CFBD000|nr:acetate--CoA ligase family protein [Vallitalea okinawensis]